MRIGKWLCLCRFSIAVTGTVYIYSRWKLEKWCCVTRFGYRRAWNMLLGGHLAHKRRRDIILVGHYTVYGNQAKLATKLSNWNISPLAVVGNAVSLCNAPYSTSTEVSISPFHPSHLPPTLSSIPLHESTMTDHSIRPSVLPAYKLCIIPLLRNCVHLVPALYMPP